MTRSTKYFAFKKELRRKARQMANIATCPLGDVNNKEYSLSVYYNKLSPKYARIWNKRIEKAIEDYYRPVVLGRDGRWYSAADMDDAMLYGINH
jgi:hypothetical protein